jgi:hypothetical protein
LRQRGWRGIGNAGAGILEDPETVARGVDICGEILRKTFVRPEGSSSKTKG